MTIFATFANGTFWGNIEVTDGANPVEAAAAEWGTAGDTDGITAYEVTVEMAEAVQDWWAAGANAAECPIKV